MRNDNRGSEQARRGAGREGPTRRGAGEQEGQQMGGAGKEEGSIGERAGEEGQARKRDSIGAWGRRSNRGGGTSEEWAGEEWRNRRVRGSAEEEGPQGRRGGKK
jgi:hypothetical protein